jgi:hypothetical protein
MCTQVVPSMPSSARFSASTPILARRFRARLHVRLVDLHHVGAGGEQVADLLVDGGGVVEGRLAQLRVVIVLGLLGHGERPRYRELDGAVGVGAQKLHVVDAHRVAPADGADDARHEHRLAAAVEGLARVVEVDAVERGGEVVRVALAADLAVGDDVEPGPLLILNGDAGRVVLSFAQERLVDAPQLLRPGARREASGEPLPVDQPVGLGIAADDGAGKQRESVGLCFPWSESSS